MTTRTFGRRGAPTRFASPVPRPAAAAISRTTIEPSSPAVDIDDMTGARSLLADIPFLTAGIILFLLIVFTIEWRLAFDVGWDGSLSVQSLLAFGGLSRDLVVGSGQWWRVGLAPILHLGPIHLVCNCVALFFVGWRLEPMIGRGWFALIFVVSALGGVAGSLYGNPPGLLSVGASGAITGLIGALFVVSFHHAADPAEQRAMRRIALRFGAPALLPLFVGVLGQVDYFAHAGGALAGSATALGLAALWPVGRPRPGFNRLAGTAALAGLALAMVCATFTGRHYAEYAAEAAQFIPTAQIPRTFDDAAGRSADLLARYPMDPRSHLGRAIYFFELGQYGDAADQLRTTMNMTGSDAASRPIREQARMILALVLTQQGRHADARDMAADACRTGVPDGLKDAFTKAKLCQ
ncbi:MAG TPA: rhomboid family intramembrane serine protease [Xanthobacteraceae bacterium]|nr:rhomboid family intramembrane serine protease [Xanthobacteraceae bacterium]